MCYGNIKFLPESIRFLKYSQLKNNILKQFDRILLVDDNEIDSFIHEQLMNKVSFAKEIIIKPSVKQAIDFLKSDEGKKKVPEIIFLDILMPGTDGFGFLIDFETLPEAIKTKTKIIMLSSSESFKDLNKANGNKNVYKFLNKPLSEKALDVLKSRF